MASCTVQWPLTFLGTKLEVLSSLMDWSLFFVVVACFLFVCFLVKVFWIPVFQMYWLCILLVHFSQVIESENKVAEQATDRLCARLPREQSLLNVLLGFF